MAEAKQKAKADKNTKSITVESGIEGINADILSELATILTDLQRVPALQPLLDTKATTVDLVQYKKT